MHVALLAAQRGGCFIVDATRQGKRFPDSFSKTIPIWACVLNRAVHQHRKGLAEEKSGNPPSEFNHSSTSEADSWDCSLHLPLWVSNTEREKIEQQIDKWVSLLWAANANLDSLSKALTKPLQPLWISQNTVVWLNEVPDAASWTFTPIILVSASQQVLRAQRISDGASAWNYIPGAADDEESWARGLTPAMFWKNVYSFIDASHENCARMVANIVERERVSRAYRGLEADQIKVKPLKGAGDGGSEAHQERERFCEVEMNNDGIGQGQGSQASGIYWIGETNLAIGDASCGQSAEILAMVDCVIDCGTETHLHLIKPHIHLPVVDSKHNRYSLQDNLAQAVAFAKENIPRHRSILIICAKGEDLSVCVCLTILLALFDAEGAFDAGSHFGETDFTKWAVRKRLVYVCNFAANARPSRGNLRQVFQFLLCVKNPLTMSLDSNHRG